MFRRASKQERAVEEPATLGKGKGHATPSRREAEAARRERARAGADKKAAAKLLRERRFADNQRIRAGMKTGEEKYLMERDKGRVRRFIRDWTDVRFSFLELMLPLLIVVMGLQLSNNPTLLRMGQTLWTVAWLVVVVDIAWLFFRLGRELKRRFPDDSHKGWRFYALLRSLQLRPLRMPKPQYKLFQQLPDRYR